MNKGLLLSGALMLSAGACSTTTPGNGTFAEKCLSQEVNYELEDGDSFFVGVQDMSFYQGNPQDNVKIGLDGTTLVLDGYSDETLLSTGGVTSDIEEPAKLTLSREPIIGTLVEEGQTVSFEASLNSENIAIVALAWQCQDK